jgi:hypothetical protein
MKKALTIISCLVISSTAWAASYSVDLEAQVDGAKPFQGHVDVDDGQSASISQGEITIKLTATKTEKGALKIRTKLIKKVAGGIESVSKPGIVVDFEKPAEISQTSADGTQAFLLKLTAHQTSKTPQASP